MRIAILGDIHSNKFALIETLSFLKETKVDKHIFMGDYFGYYPWACDTWNLLQPYLGGGIFLLGNHDELIIRDIAPTIIPEYWEVIQQNRNELPKKALEWLRNLKPKMSFELNDVRYNLVHGTPENPFNGRFYPDDQKEYSWFPQSNRDVIIMGHTHHPIAKQVNGGWILNPGSVGQPRDGISSSSFCIFETEKMQSTFYRVSYDVESTIVKLKKMNWYTRAIVSLERNIS
jgi:putative phosphoesterase